MAKQSTSPALVTTSTVPDNAARMRDHRLPIGPPASLHEGVYEVPSDFAHDPLVVSSKDALRSARETAEKCLAVSRATLDDQTETLHRRHQLARERVYRAARPAVEKMQSAIDRLNGTVDKLTEHLRGPALPANATQAILLVEARRALLQLPPADRRKAILDAIERGDPATCQAATRCEAYTLGVTDAELEMFRAAWADKHQPEHVAHLAVLRQALEHTQRGGALLLSFTNSLSSTVIAEEARKLLQRTADAVAAAGLN